MLFEAINIIIMIVILIIYIIQDLFTPKIKNESKILISNDTKEKTKELKYSGEINEIICDDLNKIDDDNMRKMLKYAVKGGKRIRSILIYSFNSNEPSKHGILFIEYLHASSLIIDDIIDGDIMRRGNDCFHIKYGINNALMVSSYLLSLAFSHINDIYETDISEYKKKKLFKYVTDKFKDLCIGQYFDSNNAINIEELMEKKTASLFSISYLLGWVNNKDNKDNDSLYDLYVDAGRVMGLIFQLVDDFEDLEKDVKSLTLGKNNYVHIYGYVKSRKQLTKLFDEYNSIMSRLNLESNIIKDHKIILDLLKSKVNNIEE